MKRKYKVAGGVFIIIFSLLVILLAYLYVTPVMLSPHVMLRPHSVTSLESANKYYGTLGSLAGVVAGGLGLALGGFYYVNRNWIEGRQRRRDQQYHRLEIFMDKLCAYDDLVCMITAKRMTDERELTHIRERLTRIADDLVMMLDEGGGKLLGLDYSSISEVLKMNSFVDKSEILSHYDYLKLQQVSDVEMYILRNAYDDLREASFKNCYRNMV